MTTGPDPALLGYIFALASFIVAAGWFIAVALIWTFVRRKVAAVRETHGELPAAESSALLFYAAAVFFWPAGFLVGVLQLKEPKTTLQARTCLAIGLAHISVIVVATCVGISVLAFMAPDLFAGL